MKKFGFELLSALSAFVAQISILISIIFLVGILFFDAENLLLPLAIALVIGIVAVILTSRIKSGWQWLIYWSLPWPF